MAIFSIFGSTILIDFFFPKGGMGKGFTKCNRCGGLMTYEKIYYETEHFGVWKCVYCVEYIDRVILENRQIQKSNREKAGRIMKNLYTDLAQAPHLFKNILISFS